MTGQQLKNSILQMAVQGKLVPQDPNDEPALVLLERIRKEKEQLIKDGKIKKEKNPSYIFRGADNLPYEKVGKNEPVCIADEVPFEIPESWEWVRLGNVIVLQSGQDMTPDKYSSNSNGIPYITGASNIENGKVLINRWTDCGRVFAYKGDILLTCKGTVGTMAVLQESQVHIARQIMAIRSIGELCIPYIQLVLQTLVESLKATAKSMIPGIARDDVLQSLFPVPPLNEQQRIVSKFSTLVPYMEQYSIVDTKLSSLNSIFPQALKKSILQEAIQGKLVPQDPADEPASVLLERIRAEKERLVQEGKIKRDKHESVIYRRDNSHYEKLDGVERCIDDEIPFEIPESWAWTSVGEVCSNIQYGSSQKSSSTGKIAVLRMGNLQNGRIVLDKLAYTSDLKEIEKYPLEYNDLLFNRTNSKELVGKVAIYKGEIPAIYAGYLVRVHPILIDSDYLNYVMQSQYYWIYCQNVRSDAIGQSNINAEKLKHFIFPLPPLQEQKRIVDRISRIVSRIECL